MCIPGLFGGGSSSADDIAKQQRADEVARQARINSGMSSIANIFGGFDDNFYNKRYGDYMDYATPQIDQQAGQQRQQMIYDLSRTGNLDSSAADQESADLAQTTNQAKIGAANQAQNEENTLRSNVENTRSSVVSQLEATGDDTAAANTASRQVQSLNQPAGFSPLGNLFSDFANSLSTIGSRAANGYSGFMGSGGTSLFANNPSGSMRVVG